MMIESRLNRKQKLIELSLTGIQHISVTESRISVTIQLKLKCGLSVCAFYLQNYKIPLLTGFFFYFAGDDIFFANVLICQDDSISDRSLSNSQLCILVSHFVHDLS